MRTSSFAEVETKSDAPSLSSGFSVPKTAGDLISFAPTKCRAEAPFTYRNEIFVLAGGAKLVPVQSDGVLRATVAVVPSARGIFM